MNADTLNLPLSCASADAAQAYVQAVDHQLHAWPGGLQAVQRAIELEPGFAVAHAAQALMQLAYGRAAQARAAIGRARDAAASCSAREQAHIAVLAHVVEGRPVDALAAVQEHARLWPTDTLAISVALGAFGLFAFSGRADHDVVRLAFVRSLAAHYPADHPWLLTQLAWAHIEAGELDAGDMLIARSLRLRSANGNAAHVMLHACFERRRPDSGMAFVEPWLEHYPRDAMLYGHLHWHAVLCELELGHIDAALARVLQQLVPHLEVALPLVGMTDIASALWRIGLAGRQGLSWTVAAQFAQAHYAQGGNPFVELHLAMVAAAQVDRQALAGCAARLQRHADRGHAGAPAALSWVAGLGALLDGDRPRALDKLTACREQSVRLGGSHAQRTVIDRTLESSLEPSAAA